MKSPVFLSQNQKKFASPLSQPNCQPIKARVLTALPWVDHNNCGTAIIEATTKKASHSRQRDQLIRARQAPTPITTMKLCACTSGNRPATTPAASIRRRLGVRGKREKGEDSDGDAGGCLDREPFTFTFSPFPFSPSSFPAAHH